MSIDNAVANRNEALRTVGKNALNVKYPDEFELYLCALELIDESNRTLKYFIFPVMPSSIDEGKQKLTNIKKTLAGVTVLKTTTFVPTDITLSGNFGRSFKVLLGGDYLDFISSFNGNDTNPFDDKVKTGYGCCKILESIFEESTNIGEDGQQRKLILHNPSIGNSYVVEALNFRMSQSEQTNMIWNYSVNFKSIAPLESLFNKKDMEKMSTRLNISGHMQKQVNSLVNTVSAFVARTETQLRS